jgi:serine/threonine-protein kinase
MPDSPVQSAKSFLKLLDKSGIVEESRLKDTLAELSRQAAGRTVETQELVDHLVNAQLITPWHVEKLMAGKYKGFFLGKYKLLGHLGTGGMSAVYLAEHKISGNRRAIKVLPRKNVSDASYLDRFYREGKAAASLDHPNVVRIYDICSDSNTHYMVMEHVQGTDLYQTVKQNGPLKIKDAVHAIIQACRGLAHAHQRELVHRDIKPANLLRMKDGTVKILDLGLALFNLGEDDESLTVLHNEKIMGTADYLSPEQAVNSHEVDHRADIYSLGCTLYYILTGHPPFPTGSLAQRIAMHQSKQPPSVIVSRADCPQPLAEICHAMMAKRPEHRYQTCDDLVAELTAFLETGQQRCIGLDPATSQDTFVASESPAADETILSSLPPGRLLDETPDSSIFAIDTSGSSPSMKGRASSSNIHHDANASHARSASASFARSAKLKQLSQTTKQHKWIIPTAIVVMFLILVAVIKLAASAS